MALSAVLVHAIPFMNGVGFTRTEAALAIAVNGGANLTPKFVWGSARLTGDWAGGASPL